MDFDTSEIKKIRKKYLSFLLPPKAKEVNFKILNEIYPTNEFLRLKFNLDVNNCVFCETNIENLEHVFFFCDMVQPFWRDMQNWLWSREVELPSLTVKIIRFGIFLENKEFDFICNFLLCLGKFFIHKCRWLKSRPNFNQWMNEFKLLCEALRLVKHTKALKLISLLDKNKLI